MKQQKTESTITVTKPANQSVANQLNRVAICEFTLYIEHHDEFDPNDFDNSNPYSVTYGFKTVRFWNPKSQTWETPDPERFRVSAETFELAKSEFWARYRNYTVRRWGYRVAANSVYTEK